MTASKPLKVIKKRIDNKFIKCVFFVTIVVLTVVLELDAMILGSCNLNTGD